MRAVISGGTGFIEHDLTASLSTDGHEVISLSRSRERANDLLCGVRAKRWDAREENVSRARSLWHQMRSLFASSTDRNSFVAVGGATTEVVGWMEAQLKPRLLCGIVGLTMCLGVPELAGFWGWMPQSLPKGPAK